MRRILVLALICTVVLAGCLGDGDDSDTQPEAPEISDIVDRAEEQRSVANYIDTQEEPRASFNYWRWDAIQDNGQEFQCFDELEEGKDYYRVSIFGDDSVMDVWVSVDDKSVDCSRELSQEEASNENIDDSEAEPIDDSGNNQDEGNGGETNDTGGSGGDLSLSISNYAPSGDSTLVYVDISSSFDEAVDATLTSPEGTETVTLDPGDNTVTVDTPATGDLEFSISHSDDADPDNNAATIYIEPDEDDTGGTGEKETNGTGDNTTDGGGDGEDTSYNLWVENFGMTPDDPGSGETINFVLDAKSDRAVGDVEVVITDKQGNTLRSTTISVNGTYPMSFEYPYDGEEGFIASIDPDDAFNETDETDNEETVNVAGSGSGDVAVTGVSTDPGDPHDQENVTLRADLSSDGYSGDVQVTFTWDGSSVGTKTVSLSSGLSTTAEQYHVVGSGSHDLTASIDINDDDGSNNDASTTVDVADYTTFNVNWEQELSGEPLNLPYNSGTIYTMASGTMTALDASSGDIQWETDTGHNVEDTLSPILADGRLFYGENQGNNAVGFDIGSQSIDWTYRTGYSVRSGAAYADGSVFMGSDDGSMYAYGATDGSVQWRKGGGELRSAPTVDSGTVYLGEWSGNVYARSTSDGSQQWSQSIGGEIQQSKPYVDGSRVYVGALDGQMYALDTSSGSIDWQFDAGGGIKSAPTKVNDMIVFGGGGGTVYSVWAANGTKAWDVQTASTGSIDAHPAVSDGTVYIGSPEGVFYGIDSTKGTKICEYDTGTGSIRTRPTIVDGSVYIGTTSNDVFSFETCPS